MPESFEQRFSTGSMPWFPFVLDLNLIFINVIPQHLCLSRRSNERYNILQSAGMNRGNTRISTVACERY